MVQTITHTLPLPIFSRKYSSRWLEMCANSCQDSQYFGGKLAGYKIKQPSLGEATGRNIDASQGPSAVKGGELPHVSVTKVPGLHDNPTSGVIGIIEILSVPECSQVPEGLQVPSLHGSAAGSTLLKTTRCRGDIEFFLMASQCTFRPHQQPWTIGPEEFHKWNTDPP